MDGYSFKKLKEIGAELAEITNKTSVTISHNFADTVARDTYFTAHPTELVENTFISVGTGYQQYIDGAWVDKSAVITNPQYLDIETIKGTTQSIIFNTDGTVQKIQHKDSSSVVVREDTFIYADNLITEVRTLSGSQTKTLKYHLDTLETEVI